MTSVSYGEPAPCGTENIRVGATFPGIGWDVTFDGGRISLDEDVRNSPTDDVPFTGTLVGVEFSASYDVGADYLRWVCQFKGATLVGRFSADFTSFDAMETLMWGPPNAETTVHRQWTVARR